jgi:guanine deaminase
MKPEIFLQEAIDLSEKGMKENRGGPFGAIVVKEGKIIGRGQNLVTSTCDPTAHAEICAIRKACAALSSFSLMGCTLYTSCEPCPMCLAAAYWARIDKIYYAARRKDAASIGFDDEWIYKEIALPKDLRALPMEEKLRDGALLIFDEWKMKQDKILY